MEGETPLPAIGANQLSHHSSLSTSFPSPDHLLKKDFAPEPPQFYAYCVPCASLTQIPFNLYIGLHIEVHILKEGGAG